ncbi:hypothetical protein BQ8482_130055 [Mesorhizobium delmotii]|uniref:Uncharacterized protein n=1 Tax=Mesorhizobium delmotii TaxID=1631247 RepID=A0A2P9AGC7_9HYPH|nr:hypothetical protein BQ8482_130055 [Mesorhizobium delmotii]
MVVMLVLVIAIQKIRLGAPRGQINHQASNVIATRFFTACIECKLSSVGANLLSNVL